MPVKYMDKTVKQYKRHRRTSYNPGDSIDISDVKPMISSFY